MIIEYNIKKKFTLIEYTIFHHRTCFIETPLRQYEGKSVSCRWHCSQVNDLKRRQCIVGLAIELNSVSISFGVCVRVFMCTLRCLLAMRGRSAACVLAQSSPSWPAPPGTRLSVSGTCWTAGRPKRHCPLSLTVPCLTSHQIKAAHHTTSTSQLL